MASRVFEVKHEEPNDFRLDFILLPYGEYYSDTIDLLKAKPGDVLRFFNGPDVRIEGVRLIEDEALCGLLSRMRYGLPWSIVFEIWQRRVILQGHSKAIILPNKCIFVAYKICAEQK